MVFIKTEQQKLKKMGIERIYLRKYLQETEKSINFVRRKGSNILKNEDKTLHICSSLSLAPNY